MVDVKSEEMVDEKSVKEGGGKGIVDECEDMDGKIRGSRMGNL